MLKFLKNTDCNERHQAG